MIEFHDSTKRINRNVDNEQFLNDVIYTESDSNFEPILVKAKKEYAFQV